MRPIPAPRVLGLFDFMVLIAAAGAGLAVFQLVVKHLLGGSYPWGRLWLWPARGWTPGALIVRVIEWIGPSLPFAGAWTGAVPILRLRAPRPSFRRIGREPGVVACLAAALGAGWAGLTLAVTMGIVAATHGRQLGILFDFVVVAVFPAMGLAVVAAWFGQAMAGRWRPVPDAVDRTGRVLGCYWIAAGLLWGTRQYLGSVNG